MTAPSRAIGLALAGLTLASGLYGTVFWLGRDRGPGAAAYVPAAEFVRGRWAPGDFILIAPFYATRARELLGDLNPATPKDPLAEDFTQFRRVWVFGLFDQGPRLAAELGRAGLRPIEHADPAPGISVDLLEVERPWTITYDFIARLKTARVFHEHPGTGLEACARWDEKNGQGGPYGRWICPHDGEWFYVAPEWHRMGDHLRFCFWAHPPTAGRLLIRFPDVPLSGHLYGHAGHTENSSLYARERIDLDVEVGGLSPQRFGFGLDENWRPFALRLPESGTATVTFAVSSPDAGANHFCFRADLRRPLPVSAASNRATTVPGQR